jgi:hypothetical protein
MSNETAQKESTEAKVPTQVRELTIEQEINVLRNAHTFFNNFNQVPGFAAAQWGQALDAIALVANSLIKRGGLLDSSTDENEILPQDQEVS